MALIVSQQIIEEGSKPTFAALTALSNTFDNSGKQFIVATYSGEGSITLTVDAYISEISFEGYGELTKTDPSITIATNETAYIGPFPTGSYIDPQGQTTFTVSANYASVRVAILEIK